MKKPSEQNISIHAPRTGSDSFQRVQFRAVQVISIHAPRTGSDCKRDTRRWASSRFQSTLPARGATRAGSPQHRHHTISIHAPRTGSDAVGIGIKDGIYIFQSTLPARGATIPYADAPRYMTISIHAPRTGSDNAKRHPQEQIDISIHAPRTGSDLRRTKRQSPSEISIHAPRTGSDGRSTGQLVGCADFNPRSPHGERPSTHRKSSPWCEEFQSTLPARGATAPSLKGNQLNNISIHAPRTGSDSIPKVS